MKDKFAKLIDLKSIVTLILNISLVVIIIGGIEIDERTFQLYSTVVVMIDTYFFTRQQKNNPEV